MQNNFNASAHPPSNQVIPTVIRREGGIERAYDIYSLLLEKRIVILTGPVTDQSADIIIAQLKYLQFTDPDKEIQFHIQSPGGSVSAGMAIYDTIRTLGAPVRTVGMGMCASMGSFLLSAGTKGMRTILPNATVMVHQPSGGSQGQQTEMSISSQHIEDIRRRMETIYAHYMGLDYPTFKQAIKQLAERDSYLNADMALKLGLVDQIVTPDAAANPDDIEQIELCRKINERELAEIEPESEKTLDNRKAVKWIIEKKAELAAKKQQKPANTP